MSEPSKAKMLWHIETEMKKCEMFCNYWLTMASTGIAKKRIIFQGDRKLSPRELVQDALLTAKNHIDRYRELVDEALKLMP